MGSGWWPETGRVLIKQIGLPICVSKNTPPNEDVREVDDSYHRAGDGAAQQRSCDPGCPGRRKIFPLTSLLRGPGAFAISARRGVEHKSIPFGPFGGLSSSSVARPRVVVRSLDVGDVRNSAAVLPGADDLRSCHSGGLTPTQVDQIFFP